MVAGVASLVWAKNPELTNVQVERMLLESADDIGLPGWDQFFGAGRVNAAKALKADPNYFLTAQVSEVAVVEQNGEFSVQVSGTAVGSQLKSYELQLGKGEKPTEWKTVFEQSGKSVDGDILGRFPATVFTNVGMWTVRLLVKDGRKTKEAWGSIEIA